MSANISRKDALRTIPSLFVLRRHLTMNFLRVGTIGILLFSVNAYSGTWYDRIWRSAMTAIEHPNTWIPLSGAVVIYATNTDKKISKFAVKHKFIYGDKYSANRYSNIFTRYVLNISDYVVSIASPCIHENDSWLFEKTKRIIVHNIAFITAYETKDIIKFQALRLRPNKHDHFSMPSGHALMPILFCNLINQDIQRMDIPKRANSGIRGLVYSFGYIAAWGKIEGNSHYPTDSLVGAAIGNFFATFFYELIMNPKKNNFQIGIKPIKTGAAIQIRATA